MVKEYSIGQLSKLCDVKVPTIRYYEEIELLEPPGRTAGGQRRYPQAARDRLSMIAHARDLGFSIDSIREFIRMADHPSAPCEDLDLIAEKHLSDVRKRIKQLQALETELTAMLKSCDHGSVAECRILTVLSDHDQCKTQH